MSKYDPLREHLDRLPRERVQLTFSEIDRLVGGLPPSAHRHPAWWSNERQGSQIQATAWLDAGRRVEDIDLNGGRVTFAAPPGWGRGARLANDSIYLMSGEELVEMRNQPYESEDLLQELLAKHPDLLAGGQMNAEVPRRWLLVRRELGVPGEKGRRVGSASTTCHRPRRHPHGGDMADSSRRMNQRPSTTLGRVEPVIEHVLSDDPRGHCAGSRAFATRPYSTGLAARSDLMSGPRRAAGSGQLAG